MTFSEAKERATKIWSSVEKVQRDPDPVSHYDANMRPVYNERWIVKTTEKVRGTKFHSFDQNGHTTCHPICASLEIENCA